jgi:hypothetical protein
MPRRERHAAANRKGQEAPDQMDEIMFGSKGPRGQDTRPPPFSRPPINLGPRPTQSKSTPQEIQERKARKEYYLSHRDEFHLLGTHSKMDQAERDEIRDAIFGATAQAPHQKSRAGLADGDYIGKKAFGDAKMRYEMRKMEERLAKEMEGEDGEEEDD